jgi:hypothetical protein
LWQASRAGGDAAAEQARAVHGRVGLDGDDGDVGNDGELRKGRGAHEVEQVLALALEAGSAVRHDSLALRGSDLAAEVGFARLAKLALLALGGAVFVRLVKSEEGSRSLTKERRRGRRASRW